MQRFGNPAACANRSVALRPRLTTGVPVRSALGQPREPLFTSAHLRLARASPRPQSTLTGTSAMASRRWLLLAGNASSPMVRAGAALVRGAGRCFGLRGRLANGRSATSVTGKAHGGGSAVVLRAVRRSDDFWTEPARVGSGSHGQQATRLPLLGFPTVLRSPRRFARLARLAQAAPSTDRCGTSSPTRSSSAAVASESRGRNGAAASTSTSSVRHSLVRASVSTSARTLL